MATIGLSVFDGEYIQALPAKLWENLMKENSMLINSKLEVKESGEGRAKAMAELAKEDDPAKFTALMEAMLNSTGSTDGKEVMDEIWEEEKESD